MKQLFVRDKIPDIILITGLKNDVDQAETAFKLIYNRYLDSLKNLACKMLKDEEEARDVVQDVFLVLFETRLHLIIPNNDIKNFLIRAVKNRCIDILRKRKTKGKYINYIDSTTTVFNNNPLESKELSFYMQQELLALPEKKLKYLLYNIFTE
jgi:RNA polymerase sigma-70 factor (ECF subfamily)